MNDEAHILRAIGANPDQVQANSLHIQFADGAAVVSFTSILKVPLAFLAPAMMKAYAAANPDGPTAGVETVEEGA